MRLPAALKSLDLAHFVVIGAAVTAMSTFMFSSQVFNDGDTYWHLATGRWILEHGRVPLTDPFSYTKGGQPWQAHEWLADIFMYGAYHLGGWSGLTALFGVATALGAAMLAARVSKDLTGVTLVFTLALALSSTSQSVLIRPHALMLPILIFWTIQILEAREKDRAPPLALAAIMIVWANLHASYIFGFVIAGGLGLEALYEAPKDQRLKVLRDWAIFGVLSAIAVVITPFGIPGVIFPFKVMSFSFLNDILEWRPYDFAKVTAFEVSLLLTILVCLSRGVKVPFMRALLLVTLLQMGIQHRRQVIVLVLIAPLLLAGPLARALGQKSREERFAERPQDWRATTFAFIALALTIIAGRFAVPLERGDEAVTPASAMKALPKNVAAMPVLNNYSIGGYLTFIGVKPYIDGRADMYGEKFVREYMDLLHTADPKRLQPILDRNKVAWTIWANGTDGALIAAMDQRPNFHRFYADKTVVIHVRNDVIAPPPEVEAKPGAAPGSAANAANTADDGSDGQ